MMRRSSPLTTTMALAAASLLLCGCDGAPPDIVESTPAPAAPAASSGSTITSVSLTPNPNPTVPLAAILHITTEDFTRVVALRFDDGDRNWTEELRAEFNTEHEVPVLGMRPGRVHTITAVVRDGTGNEVEAAAQTFETPPLPELFPRPTVTVRDVDRMEPGVTVFNVNGRFGTDGRPAPGTFAPAIIVDDEGEIIWYYLPENQEHKVHDIRRLANGNFIYEIWPGTGGMVEIDMLGNIIRRWHFTGTAKTPAPGSIPVPTDSFHHDFWELGNGNLLLMSSEARVIDDYPTSETNPIAPKAPANVIGDVIVEMTMAGDVLREWKLLDILDPYRLGYNSLREDFWAGHYDGVVEGVVYDWSHGNAIIYDEDDESIIMSVPYQDAVVKVSLNTGELVWILGNPDNWKEPWSEKLLTPVGDVEWSYKHHAISHTENGTYLLFDNGVARSSPFDEKMPLADSYSRVVEYAVNEETMEVSQVWVYGPDDEQFYGRYLGDVDWQPMTDNILINVGGQETNAEGVNAPPGPGTQRWARFMEVTHTQPAEKVWELQLRDDDIGWAVYRADRIPSVYP